MNYYILICFRSILLHQHVVYINIPFTEIYEKENGPQNEKY